MPALVFCFDMMFGYRCVCIGAKWQAHASKKSSTCELEFQVIVQNTNTRLSEGGDNVSEPNF